jgi:hypothetical protein
MDIESAYREVGTFRGAAEICATTPKKVAQYHRRSCRIVPYRRILAGPGNLQGAVWNGVQLRATLRDRYHRLLECWLSAATSRDLAWGYERLSYP